MALKLSRLLRLCAERWNKVQEGRKKKKIKTQERDTFKSD